MVTTKHLLVCFECGETFGGPGARYIDSRRALDIHHRRYKHGPEHVQADAIDRARANFEGLDIVETIATMNDEEED